MFDRFTDRARRVMLLAREEAKSLGHDYIGTEHILLGLVKEGSGVAAHVLKNMGVKLKKVRKEIEKLVQADPKADTPQQPPYTPRAKKVLELSLGEARGLGHQYVGTEHLLLGLIVEADSIAGRVLRAMGLTAEDIRREVIEFLGTDIQPAGETEPEDEIIERTGLWKCNFARTVRHKAAGSYLRYLPDEYNESGETWPLVLFLHGAGERGDDLDLVKLHGPAKLASEGRKFPFILIAPQCPANSWWSDEVVLLEGLVDEVIQAYNVDEDRVYLTGLSMGGYGTWALAHVLPDRFAALAPVCGRGNPMCVERVRHIPAWVFHGAKDEVVSVKHSQDMVDALCAAGAGPKLTIYPDAGHDSWTKTYDNEKFYEWLLQQKRGK